MGLPGPLRILVDLVVFFFVITLLPGLPPYVVFESFRVTPALPFEGKLTLNSKLSNADSLVRDKLLGPESIVVRGDELYTGIIGGQIVRVDLKSGDVSLVAKFGSECEGKFDEALCGRPLGLRFEKTPAKSSKLLCTDAYYGLFRVDIKSDEVEVLAPANETIEGKRPMIPNDLDVTQSGVIYWSDSSTNFNLQDSLFEFLGEPSGRLLKYDPVTKNSTVLMKGLHFPNGVQLFPDESSVLVSETARSRVLRYYLQGPKAGQSEIFIDGLPGSPDNIRPNGNNGFFVSLIAPRYSDKISLLDVLAPLPLVRKFISRLFSIVSWAFYAANSIYPNIATKNALYYIGHLEPVAQILPKHGNIIELNRDGEIIGNLQDRSGRVAHISQITVDVTGEFAYLGSPYNSEIWRLDLDDIRSNEHTIKAA